MALNHAQTSNAVNNKQPNCFQYLSVYVCTFCMVVVVKKKHDCAIFIMYSACTHTYVSFINSFFRTNIVLFLEQVFPLSNVYECYGNCSAQQECDKEGKGWGFTGISSRFLLTLGRLYRYIQSYTPAVAVPEISERVRVVFTPPTPLPPRESPWTTTRD